MRINWLLIGVVVFMAGLAAAACGGGGDGGGDDSGDSEPEPTATTAAQPPAGSEVDVRLFEWTVDAGVESVAAGTVTFNAANIGGIGHNLVVIRSDLAADALPVIKGGGVDEASSAIEVVGKIEELEPGLDESMVLDLEPGVYALICNIVDEDDAGRRSHYQLGMRIELQVTQ
ncbi:MAG: hypothetical protein IH866_00990 [Chloroflexi bacterium]|nr:hypothetical protein [Chloroflexota bacterium]